jgi:type IV fimbrial biogenesis protein FimT
MPVRGFSIPEMLVAMALCALLLGLAAPGFPRQRAGAALQAATGQTTAALHLARRLALARGQSVTVCPTPDGWRCGFGGGTQWMMFANHPAGVDSRREAQDELLRSWQLPAGVEASGTRGHAAYAARPGAAATATFTFRHPGLPRQVRSVVISQTGRPRLVID